MLKSGIGSVARVNKPEAHCPLAISGFRIGCGGRGGTTRQFLPRKPAQPTKSGRCLAGRLGDKRQGAPGSRPRVRGGSVAVPRRWRAKLVAHVIGTALSEGLFDERRVTSSFNSAGSAELAVSEL